MSNLKPSALRAALVALAALSALPALAQDVQFRFTELGTLTPISSLAIGGVGSTFSFSVSYATPTSFTHNGVNAFLGYDHANNDGPGALRLDNLVGPSGAPSAAVTNVNAIFTSSATAAFGGDVVGGGDEVRPFGLNVALQLGSLRTSPEQVRIFDVTLTNLALGPGSAYDLTLYHAGDTGNVDGTSTVNSATATGRPSASTSLQLTTAPVPEPASMLALAGGLAAFARRRSGARKG